MSRIQFDRLWQIQRRTFVDGKIVNKEILGETTLGFEHARRLFKKLTGIEPKESYCTTGAAMTELDNDESIPIHERYVQAMKLAFDRNFIAVPFENGRGCFAYGLKRVSIPKTDSTDHEG